MKKKILVVLKLGVVAFAAVYWLLFCAAAVFCKEPRGAPAYREWKGDNVNE